MNKAEFVKKWEHMFNLIEDRDLFPEYSSEDLPVLMLRDAPHWLIEIRERFMKAKLDLNNENVRSEIQKLRELLDRILKTQEVEVA